jgi:cysteine desulfurase/selenocysteine lyase
MTDRALGVASASRAEAGEGLRADRSPGRVEGFDVERVRQDFPILKRKIRGRRLAYLDNAATTQKPQAVLDALTDYYTTSNANVHRGVHLLSELATEAHDAAREKVRAFLNAASTREIVFTRNSTEGINLVSHAFGRLRVGHGDEVVITAMEHHSNIVPWQLLCEETGAHLRVAPIDDSGELIFEALEDLLGPRTRLVSVTHMSNALGTINPIASIVRMAHARNIPVLVDGSQAAYHMPVDVRALDCDFYVATGHKLYGPTGIGVLYGRESLLEEMPPFLGGGDMIRSVTFEKSTWNDLPFKFEAGTPDIAGAVGLGAAVDYIRSVGLAAVSQHENELLAYATAAIQELPGVRIIGTARHKASILSFVLDGVHPHDIGTIVDQEGVAIRTGHHCAQPVMARFGVPATARASFAMYNNREDVDALIAALRRVQAVFG